MQNPNSAEQQKEYLTFVKGIITEANPLTFPENASVDEDNMVLNRDGSRQRRLGIDFEEAFALIDTGLTSTTFDTYAIGSYRWDNVGGDPNVSIGVIQIGPELWFIDLYASSPSTVLLNPASPLLLHGRAGLGDNRLQFTSINGSLVVSGIHLKPHKISYLGINSFSVSFINISVRDFWGVDDGLKIDESPTSLSNEHIYNLFNQGWNNLTVNTYNNNAEDVWAVSVAYSVNDIIKPITSNGYVYICTQAGTSGTSEPAFSIVSGSYTSDNGVTWRNEGRERNYPSNVQIPHLGKSGVAANVDAFDPKLLDNQFLGSTPAPKGKFIIDFLDRGASQIFPQNDGFGRGQLVGGRTERAYEVDGSILSLRSDRENSGFRTIAAFAGRVFYAGLSSDAVDPYDNSPTSDGMILFSQIDTESNENIGKCYQDADPTSDAISDLVDTDGGYITIPDASRIFKLIPIGFSLVVVAENGVWAISGGDRGFTATEYSLVQITEVGAINAESIVSAEGSILYWSKGGIYAVSPDTSTGSLTSNNITQTTIQTLYNGIPSVNKSFASGDYDEASKRVTWLYSDAASYDGNVLKNKYNKELVLDITLQAFYSTTIGELAANSPFVAGYLSTPGYLLNTYENNIVVGGDPVVAGVSGQVYVLETDRTIGVTDRKYLTFTSPNVGLNYKFTLSEFTNTSFLDWESSDAVGIDSPAYLITGHELMGDTSRDKQASYVVTHFKRTETEFVDDGAGNVVFDRPSGCLWQARWEWSDSANGRWSPQFQAYRFTRPYIPGGIGAPFDYGQEVITTKNKVRGKGKAISFRIDSEAGKDMHILGWAIAFTGNTRV